MDTSHDRVTLTAEEQRILAVLDEASGRSGRRLRFSMGLAARAAGLRSRKTRDAGAALLFLVGAALMVGTFTRWLPAAVAGVAMQTCALWLALTRLSPAVNTWITARTTESRSDTGPGLPR
jgi:hypothetical protein